MIIQSASGQLLFSSHLWAELHDVCVSGKSSQWKGTVLDQVPVNPSLYLIKYDGFDCIYGLELYSDERVIGLEVLPDRVGEEPRHHARLSLVLSLMTSSRACPSDWSSSSPPQRLAAGGDHDREGGGAHV